MKKFIRCAILSLALLLCSNVAFSPSMTVADMSWVNPILPNGVFFKGTTSGGVVTNLIGTSGSDTIVSWETGNNLTFQRGGGTQWRIDGSSNFSGNAGTNTINALTSDASDGNATCLSGGGGTSGCVLDGTRGGTFKLFGNENASKGMFHLQAGNIAASHSIIDMGSSSSDLTFGYGGNATPIWIMDVSSGDFRGQSNGGGISIQNLGKTFSIVPYVPTMASTPVAGTNDIRFGISVIPTAAANTAALLPATGTPGAWVRAYNSNSANSVRVKAGGSNTMNGVTAGGYIVVPARSYVDCFADPTNTNYVCNLAVLPTPAGP